MIRLTKMIYLASPYSHISQRVRLQRYEAITRITGELQDKYPYAFIGPITQSHQTAKYMKGSCTAFTSWAKRDLTYISRSDEVWVIMIPGWYESIGVTKEIEFCHRHNIKVRYVDPETLRFTKSKQKLMEKV